MKIEIEIKKEVRFGEYAVKLTKANGETLHIFNDEAISFFIDEI